MESAEMISPPTAFARAMDRWVLPTAVGPVNMQLMRGIKQVFDPKMILNPGKVCYKL